MAHPLPTRTTRPERILYYVPGSTQKVCQLTGKIDHETHRPTASQTASRFSLIAADLGCSFEHEGRLVYLFGDSMPTRLFPGRPDGSNAPPRTAECNDAIASPARLAAVSTSSGARGLSRGRGARTSGGRGR